MFREHLHIKRVHAKQLFTADVVADVPVLPKSAEKPQLHSRLQKILTLTDLAKKATMQHVVHVYEALKMLTQKTDVLLVEIPSNYTAANLHSALRLEIGDAFEKTGLMVMLDCRHNMHLQETQKLQAANWTEKTATSDVCQ